MQRYFSDLKEENSYLLNKNDDYHLSKVMRAKIGDKIEIVDKQKVYLCEIESFNPVKVKVIKDLEEYHENIKKIIVVQSLVNENKMDLVLQKGCELGAFAFYPLKVKNSVVKENNKTEKKINRWQTILKEASEQSKRNIIPKIYNVISINELIKMDVSLKILLSVNECQNSLKNVLQNNSNYDTIMIVVGPEGGFTLEEEKLLMENGFIRASLGGRVLRTETASLVALSMINYEWMV